MTSHDFCQRFSWKIAKGTRGTFWQTFTFLQGVDGVKTKAFRKDFLAVWRTFLLLKTHSTLHLLSSVAVCNFYTASCRCKGRKKVEKTAVLQRAEIIELETKLTYRPPIWPAIKSADSASGWNHCPPMRKCCSPKALRVGLHRCASCSYSSMFSPLFSSTAHHWILLHILSQYPKGHFQRTHKVVRESPPWQVVVRWFSNVWLRLVYLSSSPIHRVVREYLDIQSRYQIPVLTLYQPHIVESVQNGPAYSFWGSERRCLWPLCVHFYFGTCLVTRERRFRQELREKIFFRFCRTWTRQYSRVGFRRTQGLEPQP